MIPNAPPEARRCRSCGEVRPLHEFRLRSGQTGERRHQCRACWSDYCRNYRARQREAALTGFIRALAAASNVGRVSAVAQGLMRRFGGVRRAADVLYQRAVTLNTCKPGHRQTLQALSAIAILVQAAP